MAELKDPQRQEAEGKLQFHSRLTLMAQTPVACCIQSTLLQKQSSDVWVGLCQLYHHRF